jgi:hypothetical protein
MESQRRSFKEWRWIDASSLAAIHTWQKLVGNGRHLQAWMLIWKKRESRPEKRSSPKPSLDN